MPEEMPFCFASALSTDARLDRSIDIVCRQALEELGGPPDLAMLFVLSNYPEVDETVARRACDLLGPGSLIGGTAEAIVGSHREIEDEPAVSLWLAQLGGVRVLPMHLQLEKTPEGPSIVGWAEELEADWPAKAVMLMIGEPFSFPADVMMERLNEDRPGMRVVGGMASGASAPGESRLFFGPDTHSAGAVAVMLDGPIRTTTVVSQGCRPIGRHLIVTRSEGNVVHELGGRPALLQLKEIFDTLPTSEQRLVQSGLHLGRVVNEYQDQFAQGDFLVRNVMGINPDDGSVAVGDFFRPGQTVQFHIRDHKTADEEMRQLLAEVRADGTGTPRAGLLFTCNGRGSRLFPEPHHDAALIQEYLGDIPMAGFFAAGELGPVGGQNFMHGFTASVALFEPA